MTRRLLFKYALGSTTGAGGIGAASLDTAGAGAGALAAPPQLLHPLGAAAQQPASQPVSQHDFFLNSLDNSPPLRPHPLSHPQGSQAAISQPQLGAAPQPDPQPVSQQLSQPRPLPTTLRNMFILARSTRPKSSINGLRRGLAHGSQGSHAFISQPQLGAAPQPEPQADDPQGSHALTSQPHDGPLRLPNNPQPFLAQGSQAFISQPQLGAAEAQGSQALTSQPHDGPRSLLNNPQPFLAQGSQALISQPQLGAAEAQGSQALTSQPHDGPRSLLNNPQPFLAQGSHALAQGSQVLISQPQLGAAPQPLSQQALSQPAPFRPSMRSNSPPPKLGVHRLAPSIRDPITMFHFIEFNSLNDELFYLARMAELGVWPRPVSTNEVAAEITLKPFWQRTGKKLGRFPHVQLRVPSAAQVSLLR